MFSQKYKPLDQASNASREDLVDDEASSDLDHRTSLTRAPKTILILLALLCGSIASNIFLLVKLQSMQGHANTQSFFGLERNKPMIISHDDRRMDDPMWDSPEFDWNPGWVALDNDAVEAKGVPTAMHWPWNDSKSIYLLHGFHSMHCVFVLRDALLQYHNNKKQTWSFGHITHCLHVMREDTMCSADDTPRYTGRLHAQENATLVSSGVGQTRMCRDWNKLRQRAIENSACYYRPLDHYVPLLDRYKKCPDGSKPWEKKEA